MSAEARAAIGVIGGSGVYDIQGLSGMLEIARPTPYGDPSDQVLLGELDGVRVAFLPRHGRGHRYLPTEVPYRANLWALRSLGVQRLLSVSAVGSLCAEYFPGDFVMVDQFIDRCYRRVPTFFGQGIVAHVPFGDPVDAEMRRVVGEAAADLDVRVHQGGTYVCIEGPQFSTRAESELYRSWGAKIVGMTNATEAKLAREAGIAFACIAMVTDYDCWHPDHDHVDVAQIIRIASHNAERVRELIRRSIPRLAELGPSPWRGVLDGAIMTRPDLVPAAAHARTDLLLEREPE